MQEPQKMQLRSEAKSLLEKNPDLEGADVLALMSQERKYASLLEGVELAWFNTAVFLPARYALNGPFLCKYCGHKSPNPQGRGAHEANCDKRPANAVRPKATKRRKQPKPAPWAPGELVASQTHGHDDLKRLFIVLDMLFAFPDQLDAKLADEGGVTPRELLISRTADVAKQLSGGGEKPPTQSVRTILIEWARSYHKIGQEADPLRVVEELDAAVDSLMEVFGFGG